MYKPPDYMTGSNKELEQLIQDDKFISWVITPDEMSNAYWQTWQAQHYNRQELIAEARQVVLAIYQNETAGITIPREHVVANTWQEIERKTEELEILKPGKRIAWYKYAAAAVIVIVVATVWLQSVRKESVNNVSAITAQPNQTSAELVISNNEDGDKIINLPDGSRIILSKNSSITYNRLFNKATREITLLGEAFFDIAKNPSRPFYVYSGNVVTKVLGTSFRIVSDSKTNKVTVAVKTGKVTVFRKDKEEEDRDKYVLTPSEQLVFENIKANPLRQTVLNKALIENKLPALAHFDFESASLPLILEALSNYYSVEILNENSRSEPCLVTASLSEGSLYDKLDLLHKVTGITYAIKGQTIYVDSKECK